MNSTATVTDIHTVIDAYFAMWNEANADERSRHIQRAWAPDAAYRDPLLEADGHEALSTMVAAVQANYPGHRFRLTTGLDAHHNFVRFGWELAVPGGAAAGAGIDIGELDGDSRLMRVTGFFGPLPEPASA